MFVPDFDTGFVVVPAWLRLSVTWDQIEGEAWRIRTKRAVRELDTIRG